MLNNWKKLMKKLSITLSGHQTSISLEPIFIDLLKKMADENKKSVHYIVNQIDKNRNPGTNLSSEIRIWIVKKLIEK